MKNFVLSLVCMLTLGLLPAVSSANFTVESGSSDPVSLTRSASQFAAGDTFEVNAGTLENYIPDSLSPAVSSGDLAKLGYTMDAVIDSITGGSAFLSGTYQLFYNTDGNNTFDSGTDYVVSTGVLSMSAVLPTNPQTRTSVLSGMLLPLTPQSDPVSFTGLYTGHSLTSGEVHFNFTSPAVPEPASMALLSLGGLALTGFATRRRRVPAC